jgi:putative transposase
MGPNPTDRGKRDTKRSLWTDGRGMPLGVVVDGANRHDMKLLGPTLSEAVASRPEPDEKNPQHLPG